MIVNDELSNSNKARLINRLFILFSKANGKRRRRKGKAATLALRARVGYPIGMPLRLLCYLVFSSLAMTLSAATVKLEPGDGGFKITSIDLKTEANVPGIDETKFKDQAELTKKTCPVSVALAGTQINLEAKLV